jgi:hypothetical protein
MVKLAIGILGIVASGILYRMGGSGNYPRQMRVIGCPTVLIALLWALFGFHWVYLLTFGLSIGAISTYWDWLFGYDNFYAHGLGCGLAAAPLLYANVPVWIFLIRLIVCTVGMGVWSKLVKRDVPQEVGRGIFYII